jgi:hypothetical protein
MSSGKARFVANHSTTRRAWAVTSGPMPVPGMTATRRMFPLMDAAS